MIHNIALSELVERLASNVEDFERRMERAMAAKSFRMWREVKDEMSTLESVCLTAMRSRRDQQVWSLLSKRTEMKQREFEERSRDVADRSARSKLLRRNLSAWACHQRMSARLRAGYQQIRDRETCAIKSRTLMTWMRVKMVKVKKRRSRDLADQHRRDLVLKTACFEWRILKQENRNKDEAKDKADVFREYKTCMRSLSSWRRILESSKRKILMRRRAAMHHYLRVLKGPLDRWGGGGEFSFLSMKKMKRMNLEFAGNWRETKFRAKKPHFLSLLLGVLEHELSIVRYYRQVLKGWRRQRAFEAWIIFVGEDERRKRIKVRRSVLLSILLLTLTSSS